MRQLALLFALLAGLLVSPAWSQDFPELTGRVVDNADLLDPVQESELTAKLEAFETQSQRQLVVVTLPDLQGYDIADYGYQLGRKWGIGDAERNDGALLIVAPNERKVRVEVGYGLEGIMTDALSSIIIQQQILPRFRDGDMPGGIMAGADSIIQQLQLPEEEARAIASQAQQQTESEGGFPIGGLIWFAFVFFFFILPMLRRGRRYRRGGVGGTVGDIILWEVGSAIAREAMRGGGGGSGWGGGGGFGGGGFGGGGGSFGGGGASGGW